MCEAHKRRPKAQNTSSRFLASVRVFFFFFCLYNTGNPKSTWCEGFGHLCFPLYFLDREIHSTLRQQVHQAAHSDSWWALFGLHDAHLQRICAGQFYLPVSSEINVSLLGCEHVHMLQSLKSNVVNYRTSKNVWNKTKYLYTQRHTGNFRAPVPATVIRSTELKNLRNTKVSAMILGRGTIDDTKTRKKSRTRLWASSSISDVQCSCRIPQQTSGMVWTPKRSLNTEKPKNILLKMHMSMLQRTKCPNPDKATKHHFGAEI